MTGTAEIGPEYTSASSSAVGSVGRALLRGAPGASSFSLARRCFCRSSRFSQYAWASPPLRDLLLDLSDRGLGAARLVAEPWQLFLLHPGDGLLPRVVRVLDLDLEGCGLADRRRG